MSEEFRSAVVSTGAGKFGQEITIGPHTLVSDVPKDEGDDAGPSPHDFLLAALGACTSMTVTMYARRKQFALERVQVDLTQHKRDGAHVFERTIHLYGEITDEQRQRMLDIANKCPVHRTLTGTIRIETTLAPHA